MSVTWQISPGASDILLIALCPYVSTVSSANSELEGKWKETLNIEVHVLSMCLILENLSGTMKIPNNAACI
jgi:hypothetical protein